MATTIVQEKLYTPEEYLALEDSDAYELVDGQLVERHMGAEASEIGAMISFLLIAFLRLNRIGRVFNSEANYQCFPDDPSKFRRPDVSFVRLDRLPGGNAPKGQIRVPPDLAVEVISPGDNAQKIEEKIGEYLDAGVRIIWVVYPSTRSVRVHRQRSSAYGPISNFGSDDMLSGDDVLPGFSCPVRDIFA